MKNLFLFIILSWWCYACGCPTPTNINFSENDKAWLIYQPNQTFNYYNQRGEKLTYVVSAVKDSTDFQGNAQPAVLFPICTEAYNLPIRKVVLTNLSNPADRVMIYWIKRTMQDSKLMPLEAWSVWEGKNFHAYIQATDFDAKFSQSYDTIKMNNYNGTNGLSYEFLIKKHISTKGKVYENVLFSRQKDLNTNFGFYYHKNLGVIRFETSNGDIWEIEN